MPIEALPENTIRAIGSTSVISDSYSVVKELVDNALDASATSLQIEISQNTVDVIQLKDNGHGISPEDQQYVCKRAFTSKIRTLDDLKNVGGSSLGFRGEALASAAEMSGTLAITTRTEAEVAGLCLKFGRNGELTGSQRTSHPVGTTVRITDFLKHIPVRRQTALKSATRTLSRIKKLLQAYAIAQPSKRLSVKVLRAQNQNNNWSYAPSIDPSLSDAALKVAGTEVSSSCALKRLSLQCEPENMQESSDHTDYEAVAFLPKAEFDASKSNIAGQYISVDGRPLSNNRGTGHEIVKLFKRYIRAAISKSEASKPINDPFLCLQIRCPKGAYDVNIEPAKDDLLFENRELVLALVERLFRDQYGETDAVEKTSSKQSAANITSSDGVSTGFELLMARKPFVAPSTVSHTEDLSINDPSQPRSSQGSTGSDLEVLSSERPSAITPESPDQTIAARNKRASFVNPWSVSRINASFRTPRREHIPLNMKSPEETFNRSTQGSIGRRSASRSLQHSPTISELTSPPASRFASGSPIQRRRSHEQSSSNTSPKTNRVPSTRQLERERDRDRYGNGALDTWFQRTTQVSLQRGSLENSTKEPVEFPLSILAQQRFGSHRDVSPSRARANDQIDGLADDLSPHDHTQFLPGISPRVEDQRNDISESMDSGRGFPVLERWAAQLHEEFDVEGPSDLDRALDFERRKKEAIQSIRLRSKNNDRTLTSDAAPISASPHRSRYLAAKAALTSSQTSFIEPVSGTMLTPHDPRSYLIHRIRDQSINQCGTHGEKGRKLPTHRLPFERIPDGFDSHDLGMTCPIDLSPESGTFRMHLREDLYATTDPKATAFSATDVDACLPSWTERLTLIMMQRYKSNDESRPISINLDLADKISQHLQDLDSNAD